jgi:hypothetical protein
MQQRKRLITLVLLTTLFSVGHHVDHAIRGNHVGWPLIPEITPFTYSLGFYPAIALGLYLYLHGRTAPGFWAILAGCGFFFVGLLHFGPLALEPPADILGPYRSTAAGYAALGWLIAFLILLGASSLYAFRLWRQADGRDNQAPARSNL